MEICNLNIVQEQVCLEGMPELATYMCNSILEECPLSQPDVDKHEMAAHETDFSNEIVATSVPLPFTTGSDSVICDSTVQAVEYKCNMDEAACVAESCDFHNFFGINFPAVAQTGAQIPDASTSKSYIVVASAAKNSSVDYREYLQLAENRAKEEDHLYLKGSDNPACNKEEIEHDVNISLEMQLDEETGCSGREAEGESLSEAEKCLEVSNQILPLQECENSLDTDPTDKDFAPTSEKAQESSYCEEIYTFDYWRQSPVCFSCPLLESWNEHSGDEFDFQQSATAERLTKIKRKSELQRDSDTDDPKISTERNESEDTRRPLCNFFC